MKKSRRNMNSNWKLSLFCNCCLSFVTPATKWPLSQREAFGSGRRQGTKIKKRETVWIPAFAGKTNSSTKKQ